MDSIVFLPDWRIHPEYIISFIFNKIKELLSIGGSLKLVFDL